MTNLFPPFHWYIHHMITTLQSCFGSRRNILHSVMYLNNWYLDNYETFRKWALVGGCGTMWMSIEANLHFALSVSPVLPLIVGVRCWQDVCSILSAMMNWTLWNCEQDISFFLSMVDDSYLFFIFLRKATNANDFITLESDDLIGLLVCCSSPILYMSQLTPHSDVFYTNENHQANLTSDSLC